MPWGDIVRTRPSPVKSLHTQAATSRKTIYRVKLTYYTRSSWCAASIGQPREFAPSLPVHAHEWPASGVGLGACAYAPKSHSAGGKKRSRG